MCRFPKCVLSLIGAVVLAAWSVAMPVERVAAQDPFGGGADPFGGPRPAAGPAGGVFGGPPAGGAAQPTEDLDPVVQAIRDSNPRTAAELMRAAQAMLDHGRPDEAQRYLQQVLAARPDVPELAQLDRRFGSALFMRLRRDERVQPEGGQVADLALSAAQQWSQDPQRLQGLVRQVNDASAEQRLAALTDLRSAGLAAVNPILNALRDPARANEHAGLRQALVNLGPAYAEPLLAVLQAEGEEDADLRVQVIEVLGDLGSRPAIRYLVKPAVAAGEDERAASAARQALSDIVGAVPTRGEAERFLALEARELLDAANLPQGAGSVEVWQWDADQHAVVRLRVSAGQAAIVQAARLADDLFALDPESGDYRRLHLLANLEAAKRLGGFGRPLATGPGTAHAKAAAAGSGAVEDVLGEAMRQGWLGAAIGAAEVLGEIGGPELLYTYSSSPSTLLDALRHSNRRLRFAAAMAIMRLDPERRYAGSSFLVESLGYLVSTTGYRRALVIHPRLEVAQSMVGLLMEVGYEGDSAQTGHQALLAANRQPDYELVLISPFVDGPSYEELIHLLRRNPRTANLPVGILARPEQLDAARQVADRDPLARAFPRPHDASTISYVIGDLLALSPVDHVPQEERQQQASAALDALLRLAGDPPRYAFYDLLRQEPQVEVALRRGALRNRASQLLGLLGSPAAQQALVEVASQPALPLEDRRQAVRSFEQAVANRRLLLTTGEIQRQYDRYNQSATLDKGTQEVLGEVLDVIESRWRAEQEVLRAGKAEAATPEPVPSEPTAPEPVPPEAASPKAASPEAASPEAASPEPAPPAAANGAPNPANPLPGPPG